MKFHFQKCLLLLFLSSFFLLEIAAQENVDYGLRFNSYRYVKEDRTSLNLTPTKSLVLPAKYTISFDLKFDPDQDLFGLIFRLINGHNHIDYLLYNKGISVNTNIEIFETSFEEANIDSHNWFPVKVTIDTRKKEIISLIGNKEVAGEISFLEDFDKVNIVFGRCDYPGFQYAEISPMSIKNLKITDAKEKTIYQWTLYKYAENGVYDDIRNHFAASQNPNWIIKDHIHWEKQISFESRFMPQINYNSQKNEIFLYDLQSFFQLDVNSNTLVTNPVYNAYPYIHQSNNLIYNPLSDNYIWYTFIYDVGNVVLEYDSIKKDWNVQSQKITPPHYWQHNRFFSETENKLYIFGGYGHHSYRKEAQIYDFTTNLWQRREITGDGLPPRYLSGLGKLDDQHILIFGGYGSKMASQGLSPHFYYDLYKINIKTLESEKIWTLSSPENDFAVSNSIVVDTVRNSFYALTFPTEKFQSQLSLLRFSLDKPEYEVLANSIPVNFEDTRSIFDLYLDQDNQKLIALTSFRETMNDSTNINSLYSLAYPPLLKSEILQEKKSKDRFNQIAFLVFFLLAFIFFFRIKKKKRLKGIVSEDKNPNTYINKDEKSSSIRFFGEFNVIDKDGNDITKEFTPLFRQLFVIIVLYTFKEGKGISSGKLKEIFWYDKSDESAKNNRGVAIRKLRQLLERVGNVNIISHNSFWKIDFGNIYSDYSQVLHLMDKLSNNESVRLDDLNNLLNIVSKGELLPAFQTEWIDPFKADFSNTLIDLLLKISNQKEIKIAPQICINLTDAIFIHDPLNEDALRLKCTSFVHLGRNGLAKKTYLTFVKEYKLLFGSEFGYSFEQIINS